MTTRDEQRRRARNWIVACCAGSTIVAFAAFHPAVAQNIHQYETPQVFQASDLLASDQLKGSNHEVDQPVYNDGFNNRYTLTTPFGPASVEGRALLETRVHELNALQEMEKLGRTQMFSEAFGAAAVSPLRGIKALVTNPGEAVSGIATGVGKMFTSVRHSLMGSSSAGEEDTLRSVIGYATFKRRLAFKLGVDPYSTYAPLQRRLSDLSWAGFAGGATIDGALFAVTGGAAAAITGTRFVDDMDKLVRDRTPGELAKLNRKKLQEMGIGASVAKLFLDHPKYTLTEKTYLVGALGRMSGVEDREIVVRAAILAQENSVAAYHVQRAVLTAEYHAKVSPVVKFVEFGATPLVVKGNGTVVGLFPFDHLAWTKTVAGFVDNIVDGAQKLPEAKGVELWIDGTVSPFARGNIERLGWTVRENVGHVIKGS